MKPKQSFFLFLAFLMMCLDIHAKNFRIESPDGKITVEVIVDNQISWSVTMDGKQIIDPSPIALQLETETLGISPGLLKSEQKEINETTQADVPYKFKNVVDHCNQLLLNFRRDYAIRFRAYDNGVAYRFEIGKKGEITVKDEICRFNFTRGCSVLFPEEKNFQTGFEPHYTDTLLAAIGTKQFCSLPALVTTADGMKIGITETGQSRYPAMFLQGTERNSLKAIFPPFPRTEWAKSSFFYNKEVLKEKIIENESYIARVSGSITLPWRCLMLAREDVELIENNLPYILAEKKVIEDISWIKPGKAAWEWWSACNVFGVDFKSGINTDTYKYYIDFASEYGLEYIIMDGQWSEYIRIDKPSPNVDIERIISYGKEKNVRVILWVHWGALVKDLEKYLKIFSDWGAAGIKVDFLNRADQSMVSYFEDIAAVAAKNKLMVDFHGAFKANGLQRKYPNVVNFEGVYGGEMNKFTNKVTPGHNVTIPFTRMLAGPMDYTPGAMRNETEKGFNVNYSIPVSQGTRCHQAAMYVVYEAPLQMLCDNASLYRQEPEYTRFIAGVPVTWDETVGLAGRAKEYIVVARKNGDSWYIGAMTGWTAREVEVDLSFIGEGNWEMECVADGINADRFASDYILKKEKLKNKKLKISMAPGGGYAAVLRKIN